MKKERMSWEEMKTNFPNQWLLITDFSLGEYGEVSEGVVERHSESRDEIASPPFFERDSATCFTGESTFAGLRSHAQNNDAV